MNFVNELKRRIAKMEQDLDPLKDIKDREKTKPQLEVPWDTKLYSIYKRSLPVDINHPVLMNLTEDDAKRALRRLKTQNHSDPDGSKHAIYYDMVLQSDPRQISPFWNGRPLTVIEGSSKDKEVELLLGPDKFNETWVG